MRLNFVVSVEIDEAELASLNAKRAKLGGQQQTAKQFVELQLLAGLYYDKLLSGAVVGSKEEAGEI